MNFKIVLAFVLLVQASGSNRVDAETLPNVVLIISDDQGWTDYGFMGHRDIETPNLDRLASESTLFRRGYVPTALCRPSLMTLLTGHYASTHRVTGNDPSPKLAPPDSEQYTALRAKLISFRDRFKTLPELLGERGYVSHQSGKLWEGSYENCGFSDGMTRGFPEPGGRHGDDGLKIGREGLGPIEQFVDASIQNAKPFFLWYAPFMPHTPHTPPQRLIDKYTASDRPLTIARYYAMCDWFDETCGSLLQLIDDRGQRENTLVVYVTDNGWIQRPDGRGFALRSKMSPYEMGVRTPLMFRWPGRIPIADRPELVSSIDILPTILAAAGAEMTHNPPESTLPGTKLPGLNLFSDLCLGQRIERTELYGEGFAHDIADLDNPQASLLYRWCIEGTWKLILTYDGEVNRYASTYPRTQRRPQLFNLEVDPHERSNLAEGHPDIVKRLVGRLNDWYPVDQ